MLARVLLDEDREHLVRDHGHAGQLVAVQQREADVHHDKDVDAHLPGDIDGHVLGDSTVHEQPAIALDWREHARRGQARAHRRRQVSRAHDDGVSGLEVRRHRSKRRRQIVEVGDVGDRERQAAECLAELLSLDQSLRKLDMTAPQA